jgi:hypothetical protein
MYRYSAYGLRIDSEFPLPGLLAAPAGDPDVVLRAGEVEPAPEPAPAPLFRGNAEDGCLYWDPVGATRISRGREVVLDVHPDAEEGVVSVFLIGPVLGYLLTQRGLTALHASAVALDGQAVAFLGAAGWGKSTLAAALHARGHPVVADDIVAVRMDGGRAYVFPGFPQLKLWPEAALELGDDPAQLDRLVRTAEKRARPTPAGFPEDELPLAAIYVLADGEELRVDDLRPADAVIELVRHAWGARSLHPTGPTRRLTRFAELANVVPIRRLYRPEPPAPVAELGAFVERAIAEEAT